MLDVALMVASLVASLVASSFCADGVARRFVGVGLVVDILSL
jgi:hypothetical protein